MSQVTTLDLILLPLSFVYVFGIIGIATWLKSREIISGITARKVVHIGVGSLSIGIPLMFSSNIIPLVVGFSFIGITFITSPVSPVKKFRLAAFKEGHGLGTVYYSISLTTMFYLYFDDPWLIQASFLPLVIGDAMANLIGIKYGKHKWRIFKDKSIEGSLAAFISTFIILILSLSFYNLIHKFPFPVSYILIISVVNGLITMIVELISPKGLDNITIPLFCLLFAISLV